MSKSRDELAEEYSSNLEKKVGCGIEFTTNEIKDAYIAGYIEGERKGYFEGLLE